MTDRNHTHAHTDADEPHFEVTVYPDWSVTHVDTEGIHLMFYDQGCAYSKKIGLDKNCERTYLRKFKEMSYDSEEEYEDDFSDCEIEDNNDDEVHDVKNPKIVELKKTYDFVDTQKYSTVWVNKYVKENPGDHDYILNVIHKDECDYEYK